MESYYRSSLVDDMIFRRWVRGNQKKDFLKEMLKQLSEKIMEKIRTQRKVKGEIMPVNEPDDGGNEEEYLTTIIWSRAGARKSDCNSRRNKKDNWRDERYN